MLAALLLGAGVVLVVCVQPTSGASCTTPGYYCEPDSPIAQPCPVGHFCVMGVDSPLPCPAGTYSNARMLDQEAQCDACPQGMFCPAGTATPLACLPGTYGATGGLSTAEQCTACDEGSYCVGGGSAVSDVCPLGHYCPQGTTHATQFPCVVGTHNPSTGGTSASDCVACSAGNYCDDEGMYEELPCPAHHYCPGGTSVPCAAGTYNPSLGQSTCQPCPGGSYCLEGAGDVTCPKGHYCPEGTQYATQFPCTDGTANDALGRSTACDQCAAGTYCEGEGTVTAQTCPPGHYCVLGTGTPPPCVAGTYNSASGAQADTACAQCESGFYCVEGSTSSDAECPRGHYCPPGTEYATQYPCPQGTHLNATQQSDSSVCEACPVTTYGAWPGAESGAACVLCTGGFYCNSTGLAAPVGACPAGFYCPPGTSDPLVCHPRAVNYTVANIAFTDTDSRPNMISGVVTWDAAYGTFDSYVVYASTNGEQRSLFLSSQGTVYPYPTSWDVPFGTNAFTVLRGTAIASSQTHYEVPGRVLVVAKNAYGEQCADLASVAFVDLTSPSNLTFTDQDTTHGEVQGTVEWVGGVAADLSGYNLYWSDGGKQRTTLYASVSATATSVVVPANTAAAASHWLLVMVGSDGEYSHYVSMEIADLGVPLETVSSVAFSDTHVTNGHISGRVTWAIPEDETTITHYAVYASTDGTTRSALLSGEGIAVGGNFFDIDDAQWSGGGGWNGTYLVVVAVNDIGEAVTGANVEVVDVSTPLSVVSNAEFSDQQTEPNQIAGYVRWDALDADDFTEIRVYGSVDGEERTQELTSGLWDQYTRARNGEAPAAYIDTTDVYGWSHIIVVTANQHGESTEGTAIALEDIGVVPVTGLLASPVSAVEVMLTWDDSSAHTEYTVFRLDHDNEDDGYLEVSSGQSGTSFSDTDVSISDDGVNVYTYQVVAAYNGVFEETGAFVSVEPAARVVAEAFSEIRVRAVDATTVTLRWAPDFRATHYYVQHQASGESSYTVAGSVSAGQVLYTADHDIFPGTTHSAALEFTVEGLTAGVEYSVQVVAANVHGNQTTNIPTVTVTTTSAAPPEFGVVVGQPSEFTVPLMWDAFTGVTYYQVDVKEANEDDSAFQTITRAYTDAHFVDEPPLYPGTNYTLRVSAINNHGAAYTTVHAVTKDLRVSMEVNGKVVLDSGTHIQLGDPHQDDLVAAQLLIDS